MKRIIKSSCAALGLAGALIAAGASQATAATTYSYNVTTGSSAVGSANMTGSLTFTGAKTFTANFKLKDGCPGDGASAVAYFYIVSKDGTQSFSQNFVNSGGCGTTLTFTPSFSRAKNIKSVDAVVCRNDLSAGSSKGCYNSMAKDNPYT